MHVGIPTRLFERLHADAWGSADESSRAAIAEDVAAACRAAKRSVVLTKERSNGFPVLRDERSHSDLVVVPRGTFARGYPAEKKEALARLFTALEAVPPYKPTMSEEAPWRPADLVRTEEAREVGPFLVAVDPGIPTNDADLASALADDDLALPSSREIEWAFRGPSEQLFPWGDELPDWLARKAYEHAIESLTDAARACGQDTSIAFGAFGVRDPVTLSVWCDSPRDDDPELAAAFPFAFRGGAGECAPWQGCNEWMHWLSACEVRQQRGSYRLHRVRGVVRLSHG